MTNINSHKYLKCSFDWYIIIENGKPTEMLERKISDLSLNIWDNRLQPFSNDLDFHMLALTVLPPYRQNGFVANCINWIIIFIVVEFYLYSGGFVMKTAQRLRELENLVMNMQGGIQICKFDEALTMLFVNYGFCDLIGYRCEELKAIFHDEYMRLLPDFEVERFRESMMNQLESSNRFSIECQMRKKDGSMIWVINRGVLLINADGETQVECVFTDITEQKSILEELNQKKYEIEMLTNSVDVALINCNLREDYFVNYANDGFFRLIGYTKEQFENECNRSVAKIIHPDDRALLYKNTIEQFQQKGSSKNVYRLIHRDGSVLWVLERGVEILSKSGRSEVRCVITNITHEEKTRQLLAHKNEELLLVEKKYAIAMENSEDIIFDYIMATKQIVCPTTATRKFRIRPMRDKSVNGFITSGVIHANSIEKFKELFDKIDQGVTFVSTQITGIVDNGQEILFEVSLTNIFDDYGKPVRAIGVVRNINEKRMLQSEQKYRKAMTADKLYTTELNITQNFVVNTNPIWAKSLGIPSFTKLGEMVEYLCIHHIHPDFEQQFRDFFDGDKITAAFSRGKTQLVVQYRRKDADGIYTWVESMMNIICDGVTNDINARLYVKNINDQKEREIKSLEEKRFYDAMLSNTVIVYEVSITKDLILRGNEYWDKLFHIPHTNQYTQMLNAAIEKVFHPDDAHMVWELLKREHVLQAYAEGQNEICFEYRRVNEKGEYIWMSCDAHLFLEPVSNEIKAFGYFQDINEKKISQIELLYKAEHDGLTGFYNKITVEKQINNYLLTDEGQSGKHAFFILDIDYFKSINDNFGHVFGDAVLSGVTRKMRDLFRDADILGRIGGDEFVVFMKNIPTHKTALTKAQEICSITRETYKKFGKEFHVSVSIGVAIYDTDGANYGELYHSSDSALYQAKENGRNRFVLFNSDADNQASSIDHAHGMDFIENKSFCNNMSEYVFRILYEAADKPTAINDVLSLVGKQYTVSRAYVFEYSDDGSLEVTYEWYESEQVSRLGELKGVSSLLSTDYMENFNENGILFFSDLHQAPSELIEILERQRLHNILQFAILKNGAFGGFVGFDRCGDLASLSLEQITDLKNISNALGMFIAQMSTIAENEKNKRIVHSLTAICENNGIGLSDQSISFYNE